MAYGRKEFQIEKFLFGIKAHIYLHVKALSLFNVGTLLMPRFVKLPQSSYC
jgi:hypothetical protein